MSIDEYVEFESASEIKHEYVDGYLVEIGEVIGMAGAREPHVLVATNLTVAIGAALRGGPCRAYGPDLRVRIGHKHRYRYPDLTVVCGPVELDPHDKSGMSVTNPTLLAEVTSDTSFQRDLFDKMGDYAAVASVRQYVVVSQHKPAVYVYTRGDDGTWTFTWAEGLEATIRLESLKMDLALSDVFAGVTFPPAPSASTPEPIQADATPTQ
jgi:Uma2 family endonuclease